MVILLSRPTILKYLVNKRIIYRKTLNTGVLKLGSTNKLIVSMKKR